MKVDKINLIQIIYNSQTNYKFCISKKFREKYKELYGKEVYNTDVYNNRTHSEYINVFKILGNDKSSDTTSKLSLNYIPEELSTYVCIYENNGKETITIDFKSAYNELLDLIMNENVISIESKYTYNRIKYIEKKYNENIFDDKIFNFV
jgi:hypothetical protein